MKKLISVSLLLFLIIRCTQSLVKSSPPTTSTFSICFWNLENLFDTINDPLTRDDEFTPDGKKQWNSIRYYSKLKKQGKALTAFGNWDPLDIITVCEIENRNVLSDLIRRLPERDYRILHQNSRDRRGIDVALLYRDKSFSVIDSNFYEVVLPNSPQFITRQILHATGILPNKDTLHVFVNHWSSRRGGEHISAHKRVQAASTLLPIIDSIQTNHPKHHLISVGDYNDQSFNESMELLSTSLTNVTKSTNEIGTIKHGDEWMIFDQILISESFNSSTSKTKFLDQKILQNEFLFTISENGKKSINRTYLGPFYKGGISDHLPIYARFSIQ